MKNTVYEAYTRRVMFEGTDAECERWILNQAGELGDGRRFYRTWENDGDIYWDVGPVYIFNKNS